MTEQDDKQSHEHGDEVYREMYVGNQGRRPALSRLDRLEIIAAILIFVAGAACLGIIAIFIERIMEYTT